MKPVRRVSEDKACHVCQVPLRHTKKEAWQLMRFVFKSCQSEVALRKGHWSGLLFRSELMWVKAERVRLARKGSVVVIESRPSGFPSSPEPYRWSRVGRSDWLPPRGQCKA